MSEHLSAKGLLLALATAVCSALGIATLKSGFDGGIVHLAPLAVGIVVYGLGVALGTWLIGRYAISVAYPIVVGLSLVVLAGLSAATLGETLGALKLVGTALIVLGVVVLTRRPAAGANPSERTEA